MIVNADTALAHTLAQRDNGRALGSIWRPLPPERVFVTARDSAGHFLGLGTAIGQSTLHGVTIHVSVALDTGLPRLVKPAHLAHATNVAQCPRPASFTLQMPQSPRPWPAPSGAA